MKVEIEADTPEQQELLGIFIEMLSAVSKDGGRKRAAGAKKYWRDDTHERQIFSHLHKWKAGELVDPHSGQHPLVHAAWRALAIAWQETHRDSDATGYKEDLADAPGLKTSMAGVGGMAHERLDPDGVELTADQRHAIWVKTGYAMSGVGDVFRGRE